MARVFVTRKLPGTGVDRLAEAHEVDLWPEPDPPPREALVERTAPAEALLSQLTDPVDAGLLDAAPRLKAIANYAVGYDNIDVEAATARGIPVGNTPDVLTETTAELAFGLMLAVARRLVEADAYVPAGRGGRPIRPRGAGGRVVARPPARPGSPWRHARHRRVRADRKGGRAPGGGL